jgi:V/A-type H+-transporting ATPase subunit I
MPGTVDVVFRGVKVPRRDVEAEDWEGLLETAEHEVQPIAENVKTLKAQLQKAAKQETDAATLKEALRIVSGFSLDMSRLPDLQRLRVALAIVENEKLLELRNSLPDAIVLSQSLTQTQSLVLLAVQRSAEGKLDKTTKALEVKQLAIPADLPQNPAEAYKKLTNEEKAAAEAKAKLEQALQDVRMKSAGVLLEIRELTGVARDVLDEARVSGGMKRLAMISGYVPSSREAEFARRFGGWMVHAEPVSYETRGEKIPTLLTNPKGLSTFEVLTGQQGTPGHEEVDPTPLISFIFPVFFGMMFGDFGHGLVVTLFALLIRVRGTGALRQWGNVFLAAGISATVFGAVFGEFFGLSLYSYIPIPPVIEILQRPLGAAPVPDTAGIQLVMVISILIGVAHLTTGLSLDVYQAIREGNMIEVLVGKLPTLTMYLSGVGYGFAFIGAGYSFNVLKTSAPAPLLGIPNNLLGGVSLAVLLSSMLVLFCGRAVAIKLGKVKEGSVAGALSDGGLEVFERISQFLSNTISYVRLAIMLLVHAVLLLIVNQYFPLSNPVMIAPWVILNCLVIAFEAFVVYVQDLRLHIYEFFTKFYRGTGTPFRKILPDRVRIDIKWV